MATLTTTPIIDSIKKSLHHTANLPTLNYQGHLFKDPWERRRGHLFKDPSVGKTGRWAPHENILGESSPQPDAWEPTERDYRECCGLWVNEEDDDITKIIIKQEDGYHDETELCMFASRADFDDSYPQSGYVRIEEIPEQCIPKPEPVKERYNMPYPLMAGEIPAEEPHPLSSPKWARLEALKSTFVRAYALERYNMPYPLMVGKIPAGVKI